MSAFIVSTAHIDLLVDFARLEVKPYGVMPRLPFPPAAYGIEFPGMPAGSDWEHDEEGRTFDPSKFPDQLGRALLRANWESVDVCYPGRADDMGPREECRTYRAPVAPRPFDDARNKLGRDQEMGLVLKQLDCFEYQACEPDGYYKGWAHEVVNRLRRKAYQRFSTYEPAPWGI